MKVYFVGAGPGDPELLTVRALKLLQQARICIWAGSLINPQILRLVPAVAEVHDSAGMTLEAVLTVMREARARDLDVVRLHTGEPAIYGAIGEQMHELEKLGIECEVVPGISSFQAAAAALKCELTAPELAQTVILTRTPGRTPMPATEALERLAPIRATLCLFLSTDRLSAITAALIPEYGADCPAALVYHASWPDQVVVRGTLADLGDRVAAAGLRKTGMVLVGRALAGGEARSKLYAADFSHEFRRASAACDT
jgi:precorrin-4/cobalt-precorrin-4 C11-methyltransferase